MYIKNSHSCLHAFHPLYVLAFKTLFQIMFSGSISTAEGSALVKLGKTTVVCGVKAVSIKTCMCSHLRLGDFFVTLNRKRMMFTYFNNYSTSMLDMDAK